MSLGHLTGSFMSGLLLSQFIFNVSLYNVWVEEWLSCSNDSSFYEAYDPFEYLVDKTQRQVLEEEEENIYATIAEKGLKIDFT